MADGPAIQSSSLRALNHGMTLKKTLLMVRNFRKKNLRTPIILMGYYNPIYQYGVEKFITDTQNFGVDGFIIVDMPPEEDEEFVKYLKEQSRVKRLAIFWDGASYHNSQYFREYLMLINQEKPEKEWLINCTKFYLNILKQSPIE